MFVGVRRSSSVPVSRGARFRRRPRLVVRVRRLGCHFGCHDDQCDAALVTLASMVFAEVREPTLCEIAQARRVGAEVSEFSIIEPAERLEHVGQHFDVKACVELAGEMHEQVKVEFLRQRVDVDEVAGSRSIEERQ